MLNQFSRTQLLIGADAIKKLSGSRVAVFGIGGVGGYIFVPAVDGLLIAWEVIRDICKE